MKAPWKFLAQLTSRRPSAKAQETSLGDDTDPKAHGGEVEHTSALPPNSTVAVSPPAHEEDVSVDQGSVAFGHSDKTIADDVVSLKTPIVAEEAQTPRVMKLTIPMPKRIRWFRKALQARSWRASRGSSVETVGREATSMWLHSALSLQSIKACHPRLRVTCFSMNWQVSAKKSKC